ncbi:hypothetical protein GLOIN_2v1867899 [Rhizophagus irregularis DAOM 181602=DAOM 197198]|nr:hypothetical protein GLOIN_2v1867899 [Rhizophagus irregularis DAOM 181602=DAOM 197198]CAG8555788.1 5057_t:CDS:2 [Rhizophagus irregularis]
MNQFHWENLQQLKICYCIDKISIQILNLINAGFLNVVLLNIDSTNVEIIKFHLNIYFGRELFSNIEEEVFTTYEWISGIEEPDCRSSKPKDGMWFRAKDFEGKLNNVEVRQTITKRRFINEHYQISVDTIKENAKGKLLDLQTIGLENLNWRSMESADKLSYKEIRDTIYETVQYARRIINEQKKVCK